MEATHFQNEILVETSIKSSRERAWDLMFNPIHIMKWNAASDDWHTTFADVDLRVGGTLIYHMASKDGKYGFDFSGTFTDLELNKLAAYTLEDGRKVRVEFAVEDDQVGIKQYFEPESQNPPDFQQKGWQAILDNFKKYSEGNPSDVMRFETIIEATVEQVYTKMIDKEVYDKWTSVFNETSSFEGDWNKGSEIYFIGLDSEGIKGGMVAEIFENRASQFIGIRHEGMLKGEEKIMSGPEVEPWKGCYECYTFRKEGNHCRLIVQLDAIESFKDYMNETWPKALTKLKETIESV